MSIIIIIIIIIIINLSSIAHEIHLQCCNVQPVHARVSISRRMTGARQLVRRRLGAVSS
jgi:hypothetical protein